MGWTTLYKEVFKPEETMAYGYYATSNTVYVPGSDVISKPNASDVIDGQAIAVPISGQYDSSRGATVYTGIEGITTGVVSGLIAEDLSTTTNSTEIDDNCNIKINVGSIDRIFNNKQGHLTSNTAENRKILEDVANDEYSCIGVDDYGNQWYTNVNFDGTQTWVEVYNNKIVNGGINEFPIYFDVQTIDSNSDDTIESHIGTITTTGSGVSLNNSSNDSSLNKLSKNDIKHVLNRHSYNNVKREIEYMLKKYPKNDVEKYLQRGFFNKNWSNEKIAESIEQAYNKLLN